MFDPGVPRIVACLAAVLTLTVAVPAQRPATAQGNDKQPVAADAPLRAEKLYYGVGREVALVAAVESRATTRVALALLNEAGEVKAGPHSVRAGRIDLGALMPEVWSLRKTHYLQLLVDDEPMGSALVVEPMLSRQVPVTRVEPHPVTGAMHQRIIGWRDENSPEVAPLQDATAATPGHEEGKGGASGGADSSAGSANEQNDDDDDEEGVVITPMTPMSAPENQVTSREPLLSGLRIFAEREVLMHTTQGDLKFALSPTAAPNTAWNFVHLCENGFYDGVVFHRIVPLARTGDPFVIQAGDPTGTGDGGPGWWLPIEPSDLQHDFGVISMARADDPDSAGSQFFVCLSRAGTARLDGQYCAFGFAIEGAETIAKIASVELADPATGRPAQAPMITGTEVLPAPPREVGADRRMDRVRPPASRATESDRASGRVPR
jgi:peptidyl-prolyl cis-trans isomerase B (cyclophilin B)